MLRPRTIREGSVGLLAILGLVLFGGLAIWLRGLEFGPSKYNIVVEFSDASGIRLGAPVRYRGVQVGRITGIQPSTNGVDLTIEIASADLRIPREVEIQTSRFGLVGETLIDITPLASLPPDAQSMNPLSPECNSELIICNGDRLTGDSGALLIPSLVRLSQIYSDPKFFNNLNSAAENASLAADRVAKLSDELSLLSGTVRRDVQGFLPATSTSITRAANETSQLAKNLNDFVSENRGNLVGTLNSIGKTSDELRNLAVSLETTVARVNSTLDSADTEKLMQNLETLMVNSAQASANLRDISEALNEPANLLTLQQTLDSARATFENAQKITADLDELTGDPAFRKDVRNLIKGLSSLVSVTEQLEQQVQTAQGLRATTGQLEQPIQTDQALEQVKAASNNPLVSRGYIGYVNAQFPVMMFSPAVSTALDAYLPFSSLKKYSKSVPALSTDNLPKSPTSH